MRLCPACAVEVWHIVQWTTCTNSCLTNLIANFNEERDQLTYPDRGHGCTLVGGVWCGLLVIYYGLFASYEQIENNVFWNDMHRGSSSSREVGHKGGACDDSRQSRALICGVYRPVPYAVVVAMKRCGSNGHQCASCPCVSYRHHSDSHSFGNATQHLGQVIATDWFCADCLAAVVWDHMWMHKKDE